MRRNRLDNTIIIRYLLSKGYATIIKCGRHPQKLLNSCLLNDTPLIFPRYIYRLVFSLSIPMIIHSLIFTLPTRYLATIDSADLLTCFSSPTSFSRLPFPCTLQYSSRSVGRIKLSFVDFITFLLSSCRCSVFYSFKCMFSFLRHIVLLKLLFGHLHISWGFNYLSTIHETHKCFPSYRLSNKKVLKRGNITQTHWNYHSHSRCCWKLNEPNLLLSFPTVLFFHYQTNKNLCYTYQEWIVKCTDSP